MAEKIEKTNVMRILQQHDIPYQIHHFSAKEALPGVEVAKILGLDITKVFKTLVTVGKSKEHYVFVIPVSKELDLKKAALAAKEKYIEMIPQKELLPLTGYVHGGCSPIGMKKLFVTFIDENVRPTEKIIFSAGKIGYHVEVSLADLAKVIPYTLADVIEK